MGLLNDAINETEKYIRFADFLCYLAYKLNENIEKVAIFLLYNDFDESSWEYYINRHYRIYEYDEVDCQFKTSVLLEQITKDGFFNYLMFCRNFFDDYQGIAIDLDYYEPIRIDFYYSLAVLENMPFLKKLNLDLKSAGKLDYTVYSNDSVKAEKPKDERLFRLIDLKSNHTIEYLRPSIKEYGYHSQVGMISETITSISDNTNKIPAPTVTQTERPSTEKLNKELAAAKAQIRELNEKVSGLTAENDDLKKQLSSAIDTPPNEIIDEGQGDTLLILGAVMDCIQGVAKKNYTQESLITAITEKYKNTPTLSRSTLTKKFPLAKRHLKQRVIL